MDKVGIEPTASRLQTDALPLSYLPMTRRANAAVMTSATYLDGLAGLEPASSCLEGTRSSDRAATQGLSKMPGKQRTPAGEAGVRECVCWICS